MIRLLQIEWLKNKSNPSFWILLALYCVGAYMVCSLGTVLMNATVNTYSTDGQVDVPDLNIYNFPDIWHNLTYIASYIRIFLGIMVIVAISNELSYRTMRQNIIDGMSHGQFLLSKLLLIAGLAIVATLCVFAVSYYFGVRFSTSVDTMWQGVDFIAGFFLQALAFMSFALFVALLLKSTGLAIVFTIAYSFFLETILKWIFLDSDGMIAQLLPIQSMDNLIQAPFMNPLKPDVPVQSEIEWSVALIAIGWFVAFSAFSYLILKKKDL